MSAKVGQLQIGATALGRAAALNHAAPTDAYREVPELAAPNRAGPEDESLRFSDTWDELQQQRHRPFRKRVPALEGVRFGDVLTSEEVSGTLVAYRAQHDTAFLPSLRLGTMLYERAMHVIDNRGAVRPLGGSLNFVL